MNWFSGELVDGIKQVKSEKKFLLVLCKDDTEQSSEEILSTLDNESASRYCKDMICLSISSNSESYEQFSTIYKVPTLPCINIILPSGVVFAVKTSEFSLEELSSWLEVAQSEYLKTRMTVVEHDSSSKPQSVESPEPRKVTMEEKLEHARKLLESKREEELLQEFEKSHSSEIERRQTGKKLTDFKQRQQEESVREQLTERKRTKAEDKAARERVLRQIEIDRQDRQRVLSSAQDILPSALISNQPSPISASCSGNENVVRLQIRLPDGANFSSLFPSTGTLANDVRQCIENVISGSAENQIQLKESIRSSFQRAIDNGFTFRLLRPARRFSPEDEFLSLIELDLWPSAILVLCSSSGSRLPSDNQLLNDSQGAFGKVVYFVRSGIRYGTGMGYSLWNNVISYTRILFEYLNGRRGSVNSIQTRSADRLSNQSASN